MRCFASLAVGLVLSLSTPGPLAAAPLAQTRFDLDGDRRADTIAVETPAAVVIDRATGGRAFKPFATTTATRATLTTGVHGGSPVVVASVFDSTGTGEAVALRWQGNTAVEVWRGPVGVRGRDRDHEVVVEASPYGLIRYQSRRDLVRCDGQTPWAFTEALDPRSREFRPAYNKGRIADSNKPLIATKESPFATAPSQGLAFASALPSTQAGAASAAELVPSVELDDGNPQTAWREERGGDGRGETLTFRSQLANTQVIGLRFLPGDGSSLDAFTSHNRLKRFALVTANGAQWIELPVDPLRDGAGPTTPYWVALPQPLAADCVSIVLDGFYSGRGSRVGSGASAISDMVVVTDLELSEDGAAAGLIARVGQGGREGERAAHLVERLGAAAIPALLTEISRAGADVQIVWRLRLVLARLGDGRGIDAAIDGLASAPSPRQQRELADALAASTDAARIALAAFIIRDDVPVDARLAAATALATTRAEATTQLMTAIGSGPTSLRRVIALGLIQSLARTKAPYESALRAAITAARSSDDRAREGDLWRVLGAVPAREEAADSVAVLAERLASAKDYALLYRLLQAAPRFGASAPVSAMSAAVDSFPDGAEADALAEILAASVATIDTPMARTTLRELLSAKSPGVRRAAAEALASSILSVTPELDNALIGLMDHDAWSVVRRAVAASLGRACPRPAAATALLRAVEKDESLDVQRDSLSALARCQAPGLVDTLLALAQKAKATTPLRLHAISLVPLVAAAADTPRAIALFDELRKQAWGSEQALVLAGAAAVVLGQLGDDRAVAALTAAAKEGSFPTLQSAAVSALGALCPAEALPLIKRLQTSPERQVSLAARRATKECAAKSR